jgi:hypothetical protein
MNMTNLEGRRVYKDNWKEVDQTDGQEYLGFLILAGVFRYRNQSTTSLYDAESVQAIFCATMSLDISRIVTGDSL